MLISSLCSSNGLKKKKENLVSHEQVHIFSHNVASKFFKNYLVNSCMWEQLINPVNRMARTCAYQGVNVRFSENLTCFVFLKHPSWVQQFTLLPTICLRESWLHLCNVRGLTLSWSLQPMGDILEHPIWEHSFSKYAKFSK